MKALLINPPTGLYVREDRCQSSVGDFTVSVNRPPMDLMMMASSLEQLGIECKIKDYPIENGDWNVFKSDFLAFYPNALILSITTPTLKDDMESCRIAKEINPNVLTIAKGAHFLESDISTLERFKNLDVIIRGESELVVKEILAKDDFFQIKGITFRDANGQIHRNEDRDFLENLDLLPLPARHLISNQSYVRPDTGEPMAVIETSRGCPGNCIFCLVSKVAGKRIRGRSQQVIAGEIEDCITKYKINSFHFKSDSFTWNKSFVIGLCKEILSRNLKIQWLCNSRVDMLDSEILSWMKKAGCWAIGLGVESGNQDILDKIGKGIKLEQSERAIRLCREFRIKSYAYFMFGFPWDTEKTIYDTINFAIKLKPDFVDFFLPYPFPGTELYRIVEKHNLGAQSYDVRAYSQPALPTLSLSRDKLLQLKKIALRKFYLKPSYILRTLFTARSPRMFGNYFYYGLKTLNKITANNKKCTK
jgi:anaerobic magnesium-protoporphyrin IX monomethyl ester cyclase